MSSLILVGDRVLLEPVDPDQQTKGGLYLPASVADREKIQSGRVVSVGPGYLTANPEFSEGEPWAPREAVRYLPLQAQPGDLAFYLKNEAVALRYHDVDYRIVHHHAIVALVRSEEDQLEDGLTDLDDLSDLLG